MSNFYLQKIVKEQSVVILRNFLNIFIFMIHFDMIYYRWYRFFLLSQFLEHPLDLLFLQKETIWKIFVFLYIYIHYVNYLNWQYHHHPSIVVWYSFNWYYVAVFRYSKKNVFVVFLLYFIVSSNPSNVSNFDKSDNWSLFACLIFFVITISVRALFRKSAVFVDCIIDNIYHINV